MIDWSTLSHAYGEATDIPELIRQFRGHPSEATSKELWSCLCHQGTVYPASFAALQPLCELAKGLSPLERLSPLMLIGAIIASDDLVGVDQRPTDMIQAVIPDAETLMEDCLVSGELDQEAFIYCLQTLCALAGHLFWGRNLSYLVDGEFSGNCPACGHSLYFVMGAYGFFCVGEEWIGPRRHASTQSPIFPSPLQHLSPVAAWLHQKAVTYDRLDIAKQILHLFGTTKCPKCDVMFEISPAIAQANGSSGD